MWGMTDCLHSSEEDANQVLVTTERCQDVTAMRFLEKDPNATAGNAIVFIHSLLLAAIAFCKADRVITALSQHQVLWVGDQVKLLLPRVTRMGSRDGVTSSQYRSVFVPPQARLWNWTSSEADSVYVKKRHSPHP